MVQSETKQEEIKYDGNGSCERQKDGKNKGFRKRVCEWREGGREVALRDFDF